MLMRLGNGYRYLSSTSVLVSGVCWTTLKVVLLGASKQLLSVFSTFQENMVGHDDTFREERMGKPSVISIINPSTNVHHLRRLSH
jgi:hypothetical protein